MSAILRKKQRNEDFEDVYADLLQARKLRDIYAAEAALEIQKQYVMQLNFKKMIEQKLAQFSEQECCAKCKSYYVLEGEFFGQAMDWIGCSNKSCDKWYHLQCIKMTKT